MKTLTNKHRSSGGYGVSREVPLTLARAEQEDLGVIEQIIAASISAWPAPDRLKRCVLPVLVYRVADLLDHEVIWVRRGVEPIAVAAWELDGDRPDPEAGTSTLLHGLFVVADAQRHGVGEGLQAMIAQRAARVGFNGLHVKAERFATGYFEGHGYHRLSPADQPDAHESYPYWFWQSCAEISQSMAQGPLHDARLPPSFLPKKESDTCQI